MSFTLVDSDGGGTTAASATTIASNALTGIQAGDLIVAFVTGEGASTTISVSDGTSTFTQDPDGTITSSAPMVGCTFYLLASVATGTVTYTATFGAARTFRNIVVFAFRPSGTVSFEDSNRATNSITAATSGNITTAGTDGLAFGFYGETGDALSTPLINGATPENTQAVPTTGRCKGWTKTYSAGFTGAATGTTPGTEFYTVHALAFKNVDGGGAAGFPISFAYGSEPATQMWDWAGVY